MGQFFQETLYAESQVRDDDEGATIFVCPFKCCCLDCDKAEVSVKLLPSILLVFWDSDPGSRPTKDSRGPTTEDSSSASLTILVVLFPLNHDLIITT